MIHWFLKAMHELIRMMAWMDILDISLACPSQKLDSKHICPANELYDLNNHLISAKFCFSFACKRTLHISSVQSICGHKQWVKKPCGTSENSWSHHGIDIFLGKNSYIFCIPGKLIFFSPLDITTLKREFLDISVGQKDGEKKYTENIEGLEIWGIYNLCSPVQIPTYRTNKKWI